MTGAMLHGRQVALAFDGSDTGRMLARMSSDGAPAARCRLGPGSLAVSGVSHLPEQGSFTVVTGLPVAEGPMPDPVSTEAAASMFSRLEGAFACIHWDAAAETLVVVSDFLGMAPLYWRRGPNGIALFSETKAVKAEPDPAGWGAFIALGHPIGDRTLLEGVERFPPATVLRYDTRHDRIELERYRDRDERARPWPMEEFVEAMARNVRRLAELVPDHAVFLSGGCDSRLILFLLRRQHVDTRALIVSHDDELADADGRCAVAAARAAGVPFEFRTPRDDYFASDEFLAYVGAIDAACPSLGLFIAKLLPFVPDCGVWDGLVPGYVFKNVHNKGGGFDSFQRNEIAGEGHRTWQVASRLFGPERASAMREAFERDFDELRHRYADNAEGVARFVLEQRARHRTAQNPLKAATRRATPLLPGLRRDIIEAALAIPHAQREDGNFYRSLLRHVHPDALTAPLLSGGAPVSRHFLDVAAMRVRARSRLEQVVTRYPRLAAPLRFRSRRRSVPIPPAVSHHFEEDSDAWIDRRSLADADPGTGQGFALWRLYFHWSAWRTLHSADADGIPFPAWRRGPGRS